MRLYLCFCFVVLFTMVVAPTRVCGQSAQPLVDPKPEKREYQQQNFEWRVPSRDYEFRAPSDLNSSAASLALRRDPNVTISIYAQELQEIPPDWPKTLEDVILQTMAQNNARDLALAEQQMVNHNGAPWLHMAIRAEIRGVRLHTEYWIHQHRGFLYQIVGSGEEEYAEAITNDTRLAFQGFRQLDPSRYSSKLPKGSRPVDPAINALTRQFPDEGLEWTLPGADWIYVDVKTSTRDVPPVALAHSRNPVMDIEIVMDARVDPDDVTRAWVMEFVADDVARTDHDIAIRRSRTLERDEREWHQVRVTSENRSGANYHVYWITVHKGKLLVLHAQSGHASRSRVDATAQRMLTRLRFLP